MSEQNNLLSELREATDRTLQKMVDRLEDEQKPDGTKLTPKQANELIARQKTILERVMESAAFLGHVVFINGNQEEVGSNITISCYGRLLDVKPIPGTILKVGDLVRLNPASSQIIGLASRLDIGSICFIRRVVGENFSEVDFNGSLRRVFNGQFSKKLEREDRVVLDTSGSAIVAKLSKAANRLSLGS